MIRRIGFLFSAGGAMLFTAATGFAQSQPAQDGFVPVTGVPASEQIPAAPLVVAVYAFFLLLMMFYLWTIWRRIARVEADMRALEHRQGSASRER